MTVSKLEQLTYEWFEATDEIMAAFELKRVEQGVDKIGQIVFEGPNDPLLILFAKSERAHTRVMEYLDANPVPEPGAEG